MTRPTDPPDDPVEAARRRAADKAAARAEFAARRTYGLRSRQRRKAGRSRGLGGNDKTGGEE